MVYLKKGLYKGRMYRSVPKFENSDSDGKYFYIIVKPKKKTKKIKYLTLAYWSAYHAFDAP